MSKIYQATLLFILLIMMSVPLSAQRVDEDFESISSGVPSGWVVIADESGTTGTGGSTLAAAPANNWNYEAASTATNYQGNEGRNCIAFNAYSVTIGSKGILQTPVITVSGADKNLTFDWRYKDDGGFDVYLSTDGGATYTTSLMTDLSDNTGTWNSETIPLDAYDGQTNVRVVFVATSDYGYDKMRLDNIVAGPVPTCKTPIDLMVTGLTQTSATLTWGFSDHGAVPTAYYIMVNETADGTSILNNPNLVTTGSYTDLTGLTPNTEYSVMLRGDCSVDGTSGWAETFTFTTLAPSAELPQYYDFAVGEVGTVPTGWIAGGANSASVKLSTDQHVGGDGDRSVILEATKDAECFIASPQFNHPANDMEITFKVFATAGAKFKVGLMADASSPETAIDFYNDSVSVVGEWYEYTLNTADIPAYGTTPNLHLIIGLNSGLESGTVKMYIDDITVTPIPTCVRPNGQPTVTGVTNNVATVDWDPVSANSGATFQIKLEKSDASFQIIDASSKPFQLTGLLGATDYKVSVRQICAVGDTSAWNRTTSFSTYCDPLSLVGTEYNEGFNGDFPASCWSNIVTNGETAWVQYTPSGTYSDPVQEGASAAKFYKSTTGHSAILVAPYMKTESNNSHEVVFYMFKDGYSYDLSVNDAVVVWVNDKPSLDGAQQLRRIHRSIELSPVVDTEGWYRYIVPITMTGNVFVIFEADNTGGNTMMIDNVTLRERPTCFPVQNITFTGVTSSTATFTWTKDPTGTEVDYEFAYKLSTEGDEAWVSASVSDTTFTIDNLDEGGVYAWDIRVTAVCSATDNSESYTESFAGITIPCSPTSVFPIKEDFEANIPDPCWTMGTFVVAGTQKDPLWLSATKSGSNGAKAGQLQNMGNGTRSYFAMPYMNIPTANTHEVRLMVYRDTQSKTQEGVKIWVGNSLDTVGATRLAHIPHNKNYGPVESSTGWYTYTYTIPVSGDVFVFLEGISEYGTSTYVDDFEVRAIPTCPEVGGANMGVITGSTAELFITDQVNTSWDVKYCAVPFDEATATTINITNDSTTITGLSPETEYALVVRASCGDDDKSPWIDTLRFTTACTPFHVTAATPFFEGFESGNVQDQEIGGCWSQEILASGKPWKANSTGTSYNTTPYEGSWNMTMVYGGDASIYRQVQLDAGVDYEFSCVAIQDNANETYVDFTVTLNSTFQADIAGNAIINEVGVGNTHTTLKAGFNVPTSGVYYLKVGADYATSPWRLSVDNIRIRVIDCAAPIISEVTTTALTSDSVAFTWLNPRSVPQYVIKMSTEDFNPASADGNVCNDTLSAAAFSRGGLTQNTTYYYYIKSLCDATSSSDWTSQGTFKTQCAPAALPLVETFENDETSSIDCWTSIGIEDPTVSTMYKRNGARSLKADNAQLVSPIIDVPTLVGNQFTAWVYSPLDTVIINIGVMSDPTDIGTLQPLEDIMVVGKNRWNEVIAYFDILNHPDYDDPEFAYIRASKHIVVTVPEDMTVYFDDVVIGAVPTCPKLRGITVANITDVSAEASWAAAGAETSWNVVLKEGTTVVTDTVVATMTLPLAGLTPNAEYTIDVRAICAIGDTSAFAQQSFRTTCPLNLPVPFFEDFEDLGDGEALECWGSHNHSGINWMAYVGPYTPTVAYEFNAYGNQNGYSTLTTPGIDLTGLTSAELEFDYMFGGTTGSAKTGEFELLISTDGGLTFPDTLINNYIQTAGITTLTTQTVNLDAYVGETVVIGFRGISGFGNGDAYIRIDNIHVYVPSACKRPGLTLGEVTATTIQVIVNDTTGGTAWEYATLAAGAELTESTVFTPVPQDTFVISGLQPVSTYQICLRTVCGEERSLVVTSPLVKTECAPMAIPYNENFDSYATTAEINCISVLNLETSYESYWDEYGGYYGEGDYEYDNFPYVGWVDATDIGTSGVHAYGIVGAADTAAVFVLPEMDARIDTLSLSLRYRTQGTTADDGNLEIGLIPISGPLDHDDFIRLETYYPTATLTEINYDFNACGYTGNGYRIALRYRTFEADRIISFDDLNVSYYSPCAKPAGVELLVADSVSATIEIDDTEATSWRVYYGEKGTDVDMFSSMDVTTTTVRITGLQPATQYQLYVSAICGGVPSKPTRMIDIVTMQIPAAMPYAFGDFEVPAENDKWVVLGNGCNQWAISGNDVNGVYTGTGLYVSNDGSAYNYDDEESRSWAYRTMYLEAGMYDFSCKFKGEGNYYDYARIYLAPSTADFNNVDIDYNSTEPEGFMALDGGSGQYGEADWVDIENTFFVDSSAYYSIAFLWKNNAVTSAQGPGAIDNIVFEKQSCTPIMEASIVNATTSSISVKIEDFNESVIGYQVVAAETTAATPSNALIDSLGDVLTGDTLTITNLEPSSSYTLYVRAICAVGDTSTWSSMVAQTACDPTELPYIQGFESLVTPVNTGIPCAEFLGWKSAGSYPYANATTSTTYVNSGGKALQFVSSKDTSIYFVLPEFTEVIDTLLLEFYYRSEGTAASTGTLSLGLIPNGAVLDQSQFIELESYAKKTTKTKVNYNFRTSGYTGNGYRIAFRYGDAANDIMYTSIDDVKVECRLGCYASNEVEATTLTNTSASFTIDDTEGNTDWQVSYGAEDAAVEDLTVTNVTAKAFTINSLTPNTTYKLVVNAVCGVNLSEPTDTILFTTFCDPIFIDGDNPYVEQFNNADSTMADCWTIIRNSGIYPSVKDSALSMKKGLLATLLPQFTEAPSDLVMSFYATYNGSAAAGGEVYVGYLPNISDYYSYEDVYEVKVPKTGAGRFNVDLTVFPDSAVNIYIRTSYDDISIDSLVVELAPDCYTPNAISLDKVFDDEATISYNVADNSTAVEYQLITMATGVAATPVETNANPIVLTGLTEMTDYGFIMRSFCNDGAGNLDTTAWTDTVFFTTYETAASLPYHYGFEDATANAKWKISGTGANQWIISSADADAVAEGSKAMYVSENGSDNTYNNATASTTWATQLVEFPEAGTYALSYLFEAGGESTCDFMRVYLLEADKDLTGVTHTSPGLVAIDDQAVMNLTSGRVQKFHMFQVDNAGIYKLAFYWRNDGSVGTNPPASVDQIALEQVTCVPIISATMDSIGTHQASVMVRRDASVTPISYQLAVKDVVLNPGELTQAEIAAATTYPIANGDSLVITDIKPSTAYAVYGRIICAVGDTSMWKNIVEFRTECAPDTVDEFRFYEDGFEAYASSVDLGCWTQQSIIGSRSWAPSSYDTYNRAPRTGTKSLYLYEGNRRKLSREFYLFAGTEYTFSMYARSNSDVASHTTMILSTTKDGDNNVMDTINVIDGDYQYVVSTFTPTEDGVYLFTIDANCSNLATLTNSLTIDDLLIYVDMCSRPGELTLEDLNATSAEISWTASSDNTKIDVYSGATLVNSDTVVANAENTYTLTLAPNTGYKVVVTNMCGIYSSVPAEVSFTTPCVSYAIPFNENFQAYEVGELPSCWNNDEGTLTNASYAWTIAEETGNTSNKVMRFNNYATSGQTNKLISPAFNVVDGGYVMMFDYKMTSTGRMSAYLSTDGGITYVDTIFDNVSSVSTWTEARVALEDYEGEEVTLVVNSISGSSYNSSHYIDNIRFTCFGGTIDIHDTVCANMPYLAHGFQLMPNETSTPGTQVLERYKLATSAETCDTLIRLNLVIGQSYTVPLTDTYCDGLPYTGNGFSIDNPEEKAYYKNLLTSTGCDSSVVLTLVRESHDITLDTAICEGDAIVFNGETITEPFIYSYTVTLPSGCDSTTFLDVKVIKRDYVTEAVICEGQDYVFEGTTYTETGVYSHTYSNSKGCDSIMILDLTVHPSTVTIDTAICAGQSIFFDGAERSTSGTYRTTLASILTGCDSTTVLNLTINAPDTTVRNAYVCEGEAYYGNGHSGVVVTGDTVMYSKGVDANGCDTVIQTNLRYIEIVTVDTTVRIGVGGTYDFNGNTLTTAGQYTETFKTEEGCDSIVNLTLVIDATVSNLTLEAKSLTLAPNPVEAMAITMVDRDWTPAEQDGMRVEMLDAVGRVIYSADVTEFPIAVRSIGVSGLYYIRVTAGTGEVFTGKLIVK